MRITDPPIWLILVNLEIKIYANPSKFHILSLGFSDIEMKPGFIIGVCAM